MASDIKAPDGPDEHAWRQVGERLREARVARDEDLRSIATYLRIRCDYLAALESGEIAALPGRPYAAGFMRSYATYLALDGEALAARLRTASRTAGPELRTQGNRRDGASLRGGMLALAVLLVAGTLLIGHRHAGLPWLDSAMPSAPAAPPPVLAPPRPTDPPMADGDLEQPPLAMLRSSDSDESVTGARWLATSPPPGPRR